MTLMKVTVPPHLSHAIGSPVKLELHYIYYESWYHDETQFDHGTLRLQAGSTVLEQDDVLYEDIGKSDATIIDHAIANGWFGNAAHLELLSRALVKAEQQVQTESHSMMTARHKLIASLALAPAVQDALTDQDAKELLSPKMEDALIEMSQRLAIYNQARQFLRYAENQMNTITAKIAAMQTDVSLVSEVRNLLSS